MRKDIKKLRKRAFRETKKVLKKKLQSRDALIIQTVNAIDELDRGLNVFSERAREWYSFHFPELDKKIKDHEAYLKQVARGPRDNMVNEELKVLASNSSGARFEEQDYEEMKRYASRILELYKLRESLSKYLKKLMEKEAPNITNLTTPSVGARLISLAGGLERMASMPSGTIQLLGAEKALFRHLRSGAPSPKYGVLYQLPVISSAPKKLRGKISRAMAAKLAIAAKIDFYSKRLDSDLKEELDRRIAQIKA